MIPLYDVQKQAKLIYGDRDQNSGYLWGILMGGDRRKPAAMLEMFYRVSWVVKRCIHQLKFTELTLKIYVLFLVCKLYFN